MVKYSGIIGIDEVGRGSLAGPVTVAAVFLPKDVRFYGLKDSKKLSPAKREEWFKRIRQNQRIFYAISKVSPKIIDRINISKAANLAATRSLNKLITNYQLQITRTFIYLDGGLYIQKTPNPKPKTMKTVIRGDEKINAIKLASIVAKVKRDKLMVKLHKSYPHYNFHINKGYGTKAHFKSLELFGRCEIHRLTFLN